MCAVIALDSLFAHWAHIILTFSEIGKFMFYGNYQVAVNESSREYKTEKKIQTTRHKTIFGFCTNTRLNSYV